MTEKPSPSLTEEPRPAVVTINRKPLALGIVLAGGLALLAIMFAGRPKPVPEDAQRQGASPSISEGFIEEQEAKALRESQLKQLAAQRLPSTRTVPPASLPAPPATLPSSSDPYPRRLDLEPLDESPGDGLRPGVYSPDWSAVPRSSSRPPSLSTEAFTPPGVTTSSARPMVRFRDGRSLDGERAGLPDQLTELIRTATSRPSPGTADVTQVSGSSPRSSEERSRSFYDSAEADSASPPATLRPSPPQDRPVLRQGTLIHAILETAISSERPGQATALVRRDVYDSTTGTVLVIPKASRLIGTYSSDNNYGDKRLLIAWTRLILPNGTSYTLTPMPGTDSLGSTGLRARVDNHWARTITNAILLSVVSAGTQLSQPRTSSLDRSPAASEIAAGALGQQLGEVTSQTLRRDLSVPPTLSAAPGSLFAVATTQDLVFEPYRSPR